MGKQIFISYRRSDASLRARLLKMYLMQCGYSVFMDQDDLDRTKPFPEELKKKIRNCQDFILVLSDDVTNFREDGTDFLWEEAYTAYEKYKKDNKSIKLHTASVRGYNNFEKFDPEWGHGKYREAIELFKNLTPVMLLDFEGRDEAIMASIKSACVDFLAKPEDYLRDNLEGGQSGYSVDAKEEKRLAKQGEIFYESDKHEIAKIVERVKGTSGRKLNVLDVGCANGETGKKYFSDGKVFGKVVGIDRDISLINKAWENNRNNPMFAYSAVDVCSEHFDDELKKVKDKFGVDEFDIIFCCQVLHHVAHRNRVIACLVEHMRTDGCLIIRGSDDGSKMIYQKGMDKEKVNLINEIVELTNSVPTIADRFYGRKIFFDLQYAGLKHIRVLPKTTASSMVPEDKRREFLMDAYESSFSWRQYIFDPLPEDSEERKEELAVSKKKMNEKLEKMKTMLYATGCWYSVTEYFGYGFKRG